MGTSTKKKANKPQLHQPSPTFPWRIGDIVEMKTKETGYRGAWFRVEIKDVRCGKNGKFYTTIIYKDYPDESEEEIVAVDIDLLTKENILMIRPLPPPAIKESTYDEIEELNTTYLIVRDHWEVGDVVDWWYSDCWWLAEVIGVLEDDHFQLKCPSPPHGEGGVYMAKESDMRASLNWSLEEQWTIPASKVIGNKPCARLLDPVLCQHVVPSRFLGLDEATEFHIDEQLKMPKNDSEDTSNRLKKEQKRKRKKEKKGSLVAGTLQSKGDKQPQAKTVNTWMNLENQSSNGEETVKRGVYPDESLSDVDPTDDTIHIREEENGDEERTLITVEDEHMKKKSKTDEANAVRDERPRKSTKTGKKGSPEHKTALLCGTQGVHGQQPKPMQRSSSALMKATAEGDALEMRVGFDVDTQDFQRKFTEKKRKRVVNEKNVSKEHGCVQRSGADHGRKDNENLKHFEQEKRGDLKRGENLLEQKGDMRKEVKNKSCENLEGIKKRRLEMKVVQEAKFEELSPSWQKKVVGEATTSLHTLASAKDLPFHKVQREYRQKHTYDVKFQSKAQQDELRQLESCEGASATRAVLEPKTKIKVLQDTPKAKKISRQDLKTKRMQKFPPHDLPLPRNHKLQEHSTSTCKVGVRSDNEDGQLIEDGSDITDRLKVSPYTTKHLERNTCMLENPVVLEWDLKDSNKHVNSNDALSQVLHSSSGVPGENDLENETDAHSCLMKPSCARERSAEDCVQDTQCSRGLLMKLDPTHRWMDYSSLRNLVQKPVIKYKSVLSHKLVTTAKRELWSKRKSFAERKIF